MGKQLLDPLIFFIYYCSLLWVFQNDYQEALLLVSIIIILLIVQYISILYSIKQLNKKSYK